VQIAPKAPKFGHDFMAKHNDLGKEGEDAACEFLKNLGYQILGINLIFGKAEIDILALHKNVLIVVEVKTRTSADFGNPEEFVSDKKQHLLFSAAEDYLNKENLNYEVQFDIVSILHKNNTFIINHIPNAFFPH
jgi:putative endonuclease